MAGMLAAAAVTLLASLVGAAPASADCHYTFDCPVTTDDYRLDFHRYGEGEPGDTGAPWGVQAYGVADLDGDGAGEIASTLEPHYTPDGRRRVVVSFGGHSAANALQQAVAMQIVGGGGRRFQPAFSVADVNGDGVEEIATCAGGTLAVVFGRTDGASVDLDHLGNQGFELTDGPPFFSVFGPSNGCPVKSPGDVDGDGRGDIAFTSYQDHKLKVFFTPPSPAGQDYAITGAGPNRAVVDLPDYDRSVKFATPGDLDGDGRGDIVVFSHTPDNFGHAVALMDLQPGQTGTGLDGVAAADDGFEVRYGAGDAYLYSDGFEGGVAGDVNGDGRRDLALRVRSGEYCKSAVVFSPDRGTYLTIDGDLVPGQAKCSYVSSESDDAGDVDGDGHDDIYNYGQLLLTDNGDMNDPSVQSWLGAGGRTSMLYTQFTDLAAIDDINGDGVREELALHSSTSPFDGVPEHWYVSTFLGRKRFFIPIQTETPRRNLFGFTLRGSVPETPANREALGTSGEILASADIRREGADYGYFGLGVYDVAANEFRPARVPAGLPWTAELFEHPERYEFRLTFQAPGDGPKGRGEWTSFANWVTDEGRGRPHKVNGTKRADKLRGTKRVDWIRGRSGNDKIVGRTLGDSIDGGEGRDVLVGSSGNDVIVGGPGRDLIKCGAGTDMVQIDRKDRMIGCELEMDLGGSGP